MTGQHDGTIVFRMEKIHKSASEAGLPFLNSGHECQESAYFSMDLAKVLLICTR